MSYGLCLWCVGSEGPGCLVSIVPQDHLPKEGSRLSIPDKLVNSHGPTNLTLSPEF